MSKKDIGEELPSNSMTKKIAPIRPTAGGERPEAPKRRARQQIVQASKRRKTFSQAIAGLLFNAVTRNIGEYIIHEVIVPTGKTMIEDLVKGSIEMILYNGETGRYSGKSRDAGTSKVSYGSYYRKEEDRRRPDRRPGRPGSHFNLEDIFFTGRDAGKDAAAVLDALCDELEEYSEVSVATYFELAGVDGATWTHNKWGWKDLSKAYCTHTRNGYMIVLPEPEELD